MKLFPCKMQGRGGNALHPGIVVISPLVVVAVWGPFRPWMWVANNPGRDVAADELSGGRLAWMGLPGHGYAQPN
jgi:hypothetical protein